MYASNETPEKRRMRLMTWNVRSLTGKIDKVRHIVRDTNPDIVCLQEIWQLPTNFNSDIGPFHPPIIKQRNTRGGGIATYISKNIPFKVIDSPFSPKHLETVATEITIKTKKQLIVNVYTGQKDKTSIINDLYKYIKTQKKTYGLNIVVTGDFNIDLLKLGNDTNTDYFLDKITDLKLLPWIEFPTRHFKVGDEYQVSAIDNFLASASMKASSFGVSDDTSDHFPIFVNWGEKQRSQKIRMKIRPTKPADLARLEFEFLRESWKAVYDAQDADAAAEAFEKIKDNIIDKCLPEKTIPIDPHKIKPWFTPGLLNSRNTLQKLISTRHESDAHSKKYREYKSLYNKTCRKAESMHINQQFRDAQKDTRKTWKILDEAINRKRKAGEITSLFKIEGAITNDQKLIANKFNEQYVNMGPNLAKKFKGQANFQKYLPYNKPDFNLAPVAPHEVKTIIDNMGNKTSHGHDLLTNNILKRLSYILYQPLTRIINKSISQSIFPHIWKKSRVIPLLKRGDISDTLNYRPVSLCPVASKVLEKAVHAQVYAYAIDKHLIPSIQYGFQAKNNTGHLIQKYLNIITTARAQKKKVLVTFLDFSKAFDTVPHDPFLEKIYSMGFTVRTVHWFQSYLSNRTQYVDFKGIFSDTLPITCGVPQGTCLGPLIFLLYTSDLNANLRHSILLSFADDTTVITIADDLTTLKAKIETDYRILSDWYKHSRLSLNVKKTEYMQYFEGDITVEIQGEKIKRTSEYKLVGMIIDDKLLWKQHLESVTRKLNQTIGMLLRARHKLGTTTKILVYHSLFRSYLTYGLAHYSALKTKKEINTLQSLQNSALKAVFNTKSRTSMESHRKAKKLHTVEDEIIISRIHMAATVADKAAPDNLKRIFPRQLDVLRTTRHTQEKLILEVPKWKRETERRTSSYMVPYLYNQLATEAQELPLRALIKHVKRSIL